MFVSHGLFLIKSVTRPRIIQVCYSLEIWKNVQVFPKLGTLQFGVIIQYIFHKASLLLLFLEKNFLELATTLEN